MSQFGETQNPIVMMEEEEDKEELGDDLLSEGEEDEDADGDGLDE